MIVRGFLDDGFFRTHKFTYSDLLCYLLDQKLYCQIMRPSKYWIYLNYFRSINSQVSFALQFGQVQPPIKASYESRGNRNNGNIAPHFGQTFFPDNDIRSRTIPINPIVITKNKMRHNITRRKLISLFAEKILIFSNNFKSTNVK